MIYSLTKAPSGVKFKRSKKNELGRLTGVGWLLKYLARPKAEKQVGEGQNAL